MGETGSGKDTLINKVCKEYPEDFSPVCSYTTRPKRPGEIDGREHYFVSEDEFHKLLNETPRSDIIAYTKISSDDRPDKGYEYMATISELQKHNVYIIDYEGLLISYL